MQQLLRILFPPQLVMLLAPRKRVGFRLVVWPVVNGRLQQEEKALLAFVVFSCSFLVRR